MFDSIIDQIDINCLEYEETNLLPNDCVSEVLIEAEIGQIPAALSV